MRSGLIFEDLHDRGEIVRYRNKAHVAVSTIHETWDTGETAILTNDLPSSTSSICFEAVVSGQGF